MLNCLFRRQAPKGAAYIKISESEIANDYPEPAQYVKVSQCQAPRLNDFKLDIKRVFQQLSTDIELPSFPSLAMLLSSFPEVKA